MLNPQMAGCDEDMTKMTMWYLTTQHEPLLQCNCYFLTHYWIGSSRRSTGFYLTTEVSLRIGDIRPVQHMLILRTIVPTSRNIQATMERHLSTNYYAATALLSNIPSREIHHDRD